MNDREALLTGLVLGELLKGLGDPESAFTYQEMERVAVLSESSDGKDYTNKIKVSARDGAVFMITVNQVR